MRLKSLLLKKRGLEPVSLKVDGAAGRLCQLLQAFWQARQPMQRVVSMSMALLMSKVPL